MRHGRRRGAVRHKPSDKNKQMAVNKGHTREKKRKKKEIQEEKILLFTNITNKGKTDEKHKHTHGRTARENRTKEEGEKMRWLCILSSTLMMGSGSLNPYQRPIFHTLLLHYFYQSAFKSPSFTSLHAEPALLSARAWRRRADSTEYKERKKKKHCCHHKNNICQRR